jgi:hypothetical protein
MAELAAVEQELVRSWEEREQQLDSVVHQQQFYHLATQLDRVTATQEVSWLHSLIQRCLTCDDDCCVI